ncbi:MAG: electron transfer flavoprotein subunit beta/FixA family protein [Thermoplasmata archaeon]|nr:electron transfer flavoprotein subunit beta/FixA family protein [Thermoplasmata archaeon]
MEIVVCVKPVPDAETKLRPAPDGRTLDLEGAKFVLAGYDESAVEQALLLKDAVPGSTVRVVSFGPPGRTEEVLRAALALGCDTATLVESPPLAHSADVRSVARALAAAVKKLPHDLVLVGKQSGDSEAGMLPTALAQALGHPGFNGAVELKFDPTQKLFTFGRASEAGLERWECPGPVVLGLQQAGNDPRTAKLQNILKSRRATLDKVSLAELPTLDVAGATAEAFQLPPPRTGAKWIEYKTPEEAATKLVRLLKEEAKVFP